MTDLEKYEGILLVCSYVFSFFIFILGTSVYYLTFPLQVGLFELPVEKINEVLLLALLGVVFNEGYFSKRRVCFLLCLHLGLGYTSAFIVDVCRLAVTAA